MVAAGRGERLGHPVPKAFVELAGRTLLEWSVQGARSVPGVGEVVVVAPAERLAQVGRLCPDAVVVAGGRTRSLSVAAGLAALSSDVAIVLVHDSARPLTPPVVFQSVIQAVRAGAVAAIPALPVTDTIKRVDSRGVVVDSLDRSALRAVQTPQGFQRAALAAVHGSDPAATDDAVLLERAGQPVVTVPGDPRALKITSPTDLRYAQLLLEEEGR